MLEVGCNCGVNLRLFTKLISMSSMKSSKDDANKMQRTSLKRLMNSLGNVGDACRRMSRTRDNDTYSSQTVPTTPFGTTHETSTM